MATAPGMTEMEAAPERKPPAGMDDNELASILAAHESRAVGYYNSEIADEQAKSIDYYYGVMDDLEVLDGCSAVVDHTVAVMVDNALAAVLKPFVSADQVVSFEPRGPEDVAQAEQATEYVNYVVQCDNPGFTILHDWFKDALLTKIGVVKAWWEDRTRVDERMMAMDAAQLDVARQSPEYLNEQDNGDGTFTVAVQQTIADGRVRIENVPPEEFLISPFARSIEEAAYVAHRPSNYTRSSLVELGFDAEIVESLPAYALGQSEESRVQARYRDEDWFSGTRDAIGADRSSDIIAVLDEYVRVDYDGDGVAELRRIIRVGDTILFNEVVEEAPFALLCPCPMPHKVYGRSVADQSMQGQKVSTAITRATLDNLYKTNNPRPVIGKDALLDDNSTIDDIGETAPGAAIRVNRADALTWSTVPFTAQHSFPMLEYIARGVEEQTGIQRKGQGFNAEALKKNNSNTATAAAIDENSRNERAEMIARIFAETGVKELFKLVLKMLVRHQPRERVVRLRNQWVPMDPTAWSPEMDVAISVGLGIGNKAQQVEQAQTVLEAMERLAATPYGYLVKPENVRRAIARLLNAAGIKNVDEYIGDPATEQPPEPQPSPEMQKMQMEAEIAKAESQAKIQLLREEAMAKIEAARERAIMEAQLAREKMQLEAQLARESLMMGARAGDGIKGQRPGGSLSA